MSFQFEGAFGGFAMSVIAFSIVFLVIAGLMLVMILLKSVAATLEGKPEPKKPDVKPQPSAAAASAPSQNQANAVAASSDDEGELVAVITAAISAAVGAGARVLGFTQARGRSVSAWKISGRMDNLEGFTD
jgi:Na+-transporting methylmalonyl-CoA/oxaloacetate decarboxylase gamma subunit